MVTSITQDQSAGNGTAPLNVIVVGAGFAGITAAVECQNRGMQATLVEKYTNSNEYGDIIDFFANAGRIIEKWDNGKVADELLERCITKAKCLQMKRFDGKLYYNDPWYYRPEHARRQYAGHRGEMHTIIMAYAKRLGVNLKVGKGVTQYLETESAAGVRLADGEEVWGDCVLAADGPKSLAREQVLGLEDSKVNSGYAIYRAYFSTSEQGLRDHPVLKQYVNTDEDVIKIWVGQDVHMLAYCWNDGQDFAWVLTHPDDHDIGESWSFPGSKEEAAEYLGNFDPECKAILDATPEKRLVDYKLVWRDALKTWRSKGGRTMLIGDAAHCHLPTSAQGGSQAMEDSIVSAICLDRAKGDVQLALKVAERIRYNRSHTIHQSGISNRDEWHSVPWEKYDENPELIAVPRYDWVLEYDPEASAEENFEHLAEDVRTEKKGSIEELSLPAGGSYNYDNLMVEAP